MLESITPILEKVFFVALGIAIAEVVRWLKEKYPEWKHKKTVYNYIYEKTNRHKGLTVGGGVKDLRWIPTEEIANHTNLTPDTVRRICNIHAKIRPMTRNDVFKGETPEEKWAIREFVD